MPQLSLLSPLGALTLTEEDGALVALDWGRGRDHEETPLLCEARAQLQAYFDGTLQAFDLPLAPAAGTPYSRRVWDMLRQIPFGETRTYGQVAAAVGGSPRSIGRACGANPLPILIACHRVVGSGGLGGFSAEGGPQSKRYLLDLEKTSGACGGASQGPTAAGWQAA